VAGFFPVKTLENGVVLLDRFELIEKIGQGGMGQVWRAHDRELREEIALKMLSAEFAHDPICLRQLKDEVRRGRKLGHPYIIRIYELFTGDVDTVFITMEMVRGKNINYLRAQQTDMRFSEAQVEPWLRQIASALAYAHSEGILHRDIKPNNILITTDNTAKLADFGIAVAMSESVTRVTRNTSGTPAYMSPEQIQGNSATTSSDLYSLGCTFFELLCGKPPYASGTVDTVIRQHLEGRLPEPAEWPVSLTPRMSKLLQALLQRSPEDRPAGAQKIVDYLNGDEKALNSVPIPAKAPPLPAVSSNGNGHAAVRAAKPPVLPERKTQSVSFRVPLWIPAALAVLLLLAGGGYALKKARSNGARMAARPGAGAWGQEAASPQKMAADYAAWKKSFQDLDNRLKTLGAGAQKDLAGPEAQKQTFGFFEKHFSLPSDSAVEEALARRIPAGVQLVSYEPLEKEKLADGVAVTYRVTLKVADGQQRVPAAAYLPDKKRSPLFNRLAPYLIFARDLPSGLQYRPAEAQAAIAQGETLIVPWKIRHAVKKGLSWKIVDAEPMLLQRNAAFEAKLIRESGRTPVRLLRSSAETAGMEAEAQAALNGLESRLAEVQVKLAEFRKTAYAQVPGQPKSLKGGAGSGTPTAAGVGTLSGAAVGAGIGAAAGGGDGAAIGAGAGAAAGLLGGLIYGSSEENKRLQAARNARAAAVREAERQIGAYELQLVAPLEAELKAQADEHNRSLGIVSGF
jgi:hypothetical protein